MANLPIVQNSVGEAVESDPVVDITTAPVSAAALSSVASGIASAAALAANAARKGVIAVNTDANDCFLKYGAAASTTSFTVKIVAGGMWVMPAPVYTGQIDIIWAGDGTGALYLTEL
jgi:hypothetical protein